MTWYLASAPLIPLSSLGSGAGGGVPEEGPSPVSKTWPDSGLLSPNLVQLTEVCSVPAPPSPSQFTTQLPFSHTFCPNAPPPPKEAEIMDAFPVEDLEVSEFKCHEGV